MDVRILKKRCVIPTYYYLYNLLAIIDILYLFIYFYLNCLYVCYIYCYIYCYYLD